MPSNHRLPSVLALVAGVAFVTAAALGIACSPATIPASAASETPDASSPLDATAADTGTDPHAAANACAAYAYARCSKLESCSSTLLQNRFGTVMLCEQLYTTECEVDFDVASSGTTVASTAACQDALASWACPDFVLALNIPPACVPAAGQRPNGAPCGASTQCQSQLCIPARGVLCGVCAAQPAVGSSCETTGCGVYACQGTPRRCVTYGQLGASCSTSSANPQACATGLACAQGTCQAEVETLGAACVFDGAGCDFAAGLTCNVSTGTCQTAKLVPPGSACGTVGYQDNSCFEGSCVNGTCSGSVMPGEACDAQIGPSCISPARCIVTSDGGTSGTCVIAGAEACD